MTNFNQPCPRCGHLFDVEEFPGNVAILYSGSPVQSCPCCLLPLAWFNGQLVEDKPTREQ